MALECPPEKKIDLFDHIEVHGNYVGVLRPVKTEDSDIEIPETANTQESMENAKARVATSGEEVDHLNNGDPVYVSLFMQKPHQVIVQEDRHGEEWHMFVIDSDMIVATAHEDKKSTDEILQKGSVS